MISFVVAMGQNKVIGKDNAITLAYTSRLKVL